MEMRSWLVHALMAASLNLAVLGPLAPPHLVLPPRPPIVATRLRRDDGERLYGSKGDGVWIITLPYRPAMTPPSN